jgi:hypothetical protein
MNLTMVVYMNIQETILQKFIINSISHSYRRLSEENRLHYGSRNFRDWIRNSVNRIRPNNIKHCQNSNTNLTVVNREVHLEGYESHEDVIRAYLEFSGIDPDSKEGQFYYEL